jgi:maleylpyruvate isomerase
VTDDPTGATDRDAVDAADDAAAGGAPADAAEIARDVASCVASQDALEGWLRDLDPVDPATPTRLPGWSVGHVLTHVARNADGHVSMLDGRPQYPHGVEGRNADIEAGASRGWAELVHDVARTSAALAARWHDQVDWSGTSQLLSGERPTRLLPLLRQREVEVHRVDLGLGHELDDLPADYVRRDLRLLEMLWRARRPMGLTPLPDVALAASPAVRLGWLMGRVELPGLAPAGLM